MSIFQISTLQALALGYSRAVVTVKELLTHGTIGLGTFENVNGEMIVVDGECYRAEEDGTVRKADPDMGVPFAAVAAEEDAKEFRIENVRSIEKLKELLTVYIDDEFSLNSMHVARIDGEFSTVNARSEAPYRSHHVELKDILAKTQRDFMFENITGTLVCVYYPDFMDGINASGWHIHFLSQDRTKGGHVFDLNLIKGTVQMLRITRLEIQLPSEPAFDTYALKEASGNDIRKVEQGNGKG